MFKILLSEFESFKKFSHSKHILILFLIFFAFLSYGIKIANFTLSIDEEIVFNLAHPGAGWAAQGRYAQLLFLKIFHQYQILPFWTSTLSVAFLWLSALVWCFIIFERIKNYNFTSFKKNLILFIFAALYLSFPPQAHYIFVSTYNVEVSIGCCLVAISCWCVFQWIFQRRNFYVFIALGCMSLALGIYQSFVCYFLAGISSIMILNMYDGLFSNKISTKQHFAIILKVFAFTCSSVISYLIISNLSYLIYPSVGYLKGSILWGKISLIQALYGYYQFYSIVLLNNPKLFYYKIFIATLLLGGTTFLYHIFFKKIQQKMIYSLWFLLLMVSPFLLTLIFGGLTPIRTLQSAAYLMGFLWLFILVTFSSKNLNNILITLCFLLIFLQSQQLSLLFQVNYLRSQEDIKSAHQIAARIHDLDLGETPQYPVIFIGNLSSKIPNNFSSESLGASFFNWTWDAGSIKIRGTNFRLNQFMKTLGYQFVSPTSEQIDRAISLQKNMPDWPNKNSVEFKEGLILVKLSNYSF
jgi:hypothetical protein